MSDISTNLRLLFDTSKPAQDPKIQLQWCIMPEAIEEMRVRKVDDPYLLIVVIDEDGNEQRQLVPLDRMEKLVQFSRPGPHTIHARIVWNNEKGRKGLVQTYLLRGNHGSYKHYIWNGRMIEGTWKPQILIDAELEEQTAREKNEARAYHISTGVDEERLSPIVIIPLASEVVIPEDELERRLSNDIVVGVGCAKREIMIADGHFAKQPPEWVRKWVNFPYETKPIDQCQFRKRLPFAIIAQPVLAAIFFCFTMTVRSVIPLWFWLLGLRDVKWKMIFMPFVFNIKDVARQFEHSGMNFSFAQRKDGSMRKFWVINLLFTPIILLIYFLGSTVVIWVQYDFVFVPLNMTIALIMPILLAAFGLVMAGIFYVVGALVFGILEGFGTFNISPKDWFKNLFGNWFRTWFRNWFRNWFRKRCCKWIY